MSTKLRQSRIEDWVKCGMPKNHLFGTFSTGKQVQRVMNEYEKGITRGSYGPMQGWDQGYHFVEKPPGQIFEEQRFQTNSCKEFRDVTISNP